MGVTDEQFYDPHAVAIVPMGFCFPGTGPSGDLPPRPECAPAWRRQLLDELVGIRLTLVIGVYAQAYHLRDAGGSVSEAVSSWREHWPGVVPLPHPSPRNNRWLKEHPWFEAELVPLLQERVAAVLG
jgi:uracil-DNA glycosylase